jgi:hypothetical protein
MTSSASNCIELGTSRPSALAVCRLMTNSNLVDCTTGRSAGLEPFRIRHSPELGLSNLSLLYSSMI